jgi:hypothetical protein
MLIARHGPPQVENGPGLEMVCPGLAIAGAGRTTNIPAINCLAGHPPASFTRPADPLILSDFWLGPPRRVVLGRGRDRLSLLLGTRLSRHPGSLPHLPTGCNQEAIKNRNYHSTDAGPRRGRVAASNDGVQALRGSWPADEQR